jgi:D-aminoacyl-tRNA deacylase
MVTLVIISSGDVASLNQGKALLKKGEWHQLEDVENWPAYSLIDVRMWWLPDGCLWQDDLDKRWQIARGEEVEEVIFPSRHSAASGQACLTLHPIGTMQVPIDEIPQYGGKAGDCPPPSPRLAPWWRELNRVAAEMDTFSLSLETTHHGPWLSTPCLFIEIGSTAENWPHLGAADVLADLIWRGLALDGGDGIGKWNGSDIVVITIGGGHYAPRGNKLGLLENVRIAHMLATYSLPFDKPESEGEKPGGMWESSIRAALAATQKAYPGGNIVASLEKKAFKGWQRQAIRDLMAELEVPLLRSKAIAEIAAGKPSSVP